MVRPPWTVIGVIAATLVVTTALAVLGALDLAMNWARMGWPERGTDAFYVLMGAVMGLGGFHFLRGRVWARGLLVTWLLLLLVSVLALAGVLGPWAVPLGGLSAAALALLATPSARSYVASHRRPSPLAD